MKNYKNKLITAVLISAILLIVYWWGGNSPGMRGWNPKNKSESANVTTMQKTKAETENKIQETASVDASAEKPQTENTEEQQTKTEKKTAETVQSPAVIKQEPSAEIEKATEEVPEKAAEEVPEKTEEVPEEAAEEVTEKTEEVPEEATEEPPASEKYKTDPIPDGKPVPIEPQDAVISDEKHTCTLSVKCSTVLSNMAWLTPEKAGIIPQDGVILPECEVTFYEGESVFNLLTRELRRNKIHMEFVNVPVYNSAYIEGIANLYEFDCGERSGWMYSVNGWFPNYGCSRYKLNAGDKVEWVYTCDLGSDVGGRVNK